MNDAYIFDMDGTLADCEHRRGFVASKPKNWPAFFAGVLNDTPVLSVVAEVGKALEDNKNVLIVTARPFSTRENTIQWLANNGIRYDQIYFRKDGDYRDDVLVKEEIYNSILSEGYNPIKVFDDRPKVIRMWKSKGLEVVDCGNGVEF